MTSFTQSVSGTIEQSNGQLFLVYSLLAVCTAAGIFLWTIAARGGNARIESGGGMSALWALFLITLGGHIHAMRYVGGSVKWLGWMAFVLMVASACALLFHGFKGKEDGTPERLQRMGHLWGLFAINLLSVFLIYVWKVLKDI